LGLGLPLAYFAAQKEQLRQRLSCMAGKVAVNGSTDKHISFTNVEIYPQGTGAMVVAGIDYPENGRLGLIDIGTYTTDFVLLEINNRVKSFIPDGCGSREIGVYHLYEALDKTFQEKAGMPLPVREYQRTLDFALQQKPICFDGRNIYLHIALKSGMEELAEAVMSQVKAVWGDWIRFLDCIVLVGGGSVLLQEVMKNRLHSTVMAQDPTFANALGYLEFSKAS
jgi:plasmid segregation protein ParM